MLLRGQQARRRFQSVGPAERLQPIACVGCVRRRRHGLVYPSHELSAHTRQIEEAQLGARAQPRIFQGAGDGGGQGFSVDVDQDQLFEGLGQLDQRQVEGMPGPENHRQPTSLRVTDDVLDEGAVLLGVRPPALSVPALRLADPGRRFAELQLGEGLGVDARIEGPGHLVRLGDQRDGG